MTLLEFKNVFKTFQNRQILNQVSFTIARGKTLGLVGPSGSGKSTIGKLILRLIPPCQGNIFFQNKDLSDFSKYDLIHYRKNVQVIFQNPQGSLNPKLTVQEHLLEPLWIHFRRHNVDEVISVLKKVGLSDVHLQRYPHQLSGGQCQRVAIARALVVKPSLLVCDEPLSALDIVIQAQIMELLKELQVREELSYLYISHDHQSVYQLAHQVMELKEGFLKTLRKV